MNLLFFLYQSHFVMLQFFFIKETCYVTIVAKNCKIIVAKSCKKMYGPKLCHKELLIIYFKRADRRLICTATRVETSGHTFLMEKARAYIGQADISCVRRMRDFSILDISQHIVDHCYL